LGFDLEGAELVNLGSSLDFSDEKIVTAPTGRRVILNE
jgi:hypothetical protein